MKVYKYRGGIRVSVEVFSSLGTKMPIDFKLSKFFYPIEIIKNRQFLEKSQWFSPEKLKAYQDRKLARLIKFSNETVPYYRRLFQENNIDWNTIKKIEDLPKIPLLTKEHFRKFNRDLISSKASRCSPVAYKTTGSTGEPVSIFLDKKTRALEIAYYWRHWSWCGYRLGDNFAELFGRYFISTPGCDKKISHFNPVVRRLLLNRVILNEENVELYLDELNKYSPVFLRGPAVSLYFFSLFLRSKGKFYTKLKGIYSTGEMLLDYQRKVIEDTFQCKVFDFFGHIESGAKISQCQFGQYHVDSDYGISEFQPCDNILTSNNEKSLLSQVVATSLANYGMPLIRYQLGDLIELYRNDIICKCLRKLPLVKKIHGRAQDVVVSPGGKNVCDLYDLFNSINGILFGQIVQKEIRRIEVKVAKAENFSSTTGKKIQEYIVDRLGSQVDVQITYSSGKMIYSKPLEKVRPVISEIKNR